MPDGPGSGTEHVPAPEPPQRRSRLARLPGPPRSRRGLLVLLVLVGGIGMALTLGGVAAEKWSMTAGFCGRCHTMGPELKAYAMSPHREVSCAECHVEPGLTGWVKAKWRGQRQLIQVLTGSFPEPVPPPDHAELPAVKDTCLRCHSMDQITEDGGPVKLIVRPTFASDRANTRKTLAIVLRPTGLGGDSGVRGVHWHVQQEIRFASRGPGSKVIDWVGVKFRNGSSKQYIARSAVTIAEDVRGDISRLQKKGTIRSMDCLECHNRVGHGIPSVARTVDEAIASGRISQDLPFIKRDAVSLLAASYPSLAAADRKFASLRATYKLRYPLEMSMSPRSVERAIDELKRIYRLVATPEMKVTAATYADNLGHQTSPGCFRCHDGAHYRVVNGRLTNETIPWACATCHTFPQSGSTVSDVLFYGAPDEHKDKLWVFSHKSSVASLDPAGKSCGSCHTRTYCQNCHTSGAVQVNHREMLYNHAASIRKSGARACATCHQPVYCARCHKKEDIEAVTRGGQLPYSALTGIPRAHPGTERSR